MLNDDEYLFHNQVIMAWQENISNHVSQNFRGIGKFSVSSGSHNVSVPTRGSADAAIQRVGGPSLGGGRLSWPVADHRGSVVSTVSGTAERRARSNQRTGAPIGLQ